MILKSLSGWIETIKTVVFAVLIALIVRAFAYEPFNIPSGSMIPTLLVGDYLFVSKFSYGYSRFSFPWGVVPITDRVWFSEPERGDVVVFRLPRDTSIDYIKRLVGLPGDRIQVIGGVLHINGEPVPRKRIEDFVVVHHDHAVLERVDQPFAALRVRVEAGAKQVGIVRARSRKLRGIAELLAPRHVVASGVGQGFDAGKAAAPGLDQMVEPIDNLTLPLLLFRGRRLVNW